MGQFEAAPDHFDPSSTKETVSHSNEKQGKTQSVGKRSGIESPKRWNAAGYANCADF